MTGRRAGTDARDPKIVKLIIDMGGGYKTAATFDKLTDVLSGSRIRFQYV